MMIDWEGIIKVWGWERILYLLIGAILAILVGVFWSLYSNNKKRLRSILQNPKEKLNKTNDFSDDDNDNNG